MPAVDRHYWTAADVRALIDESHPSPRYELLDGELLVTPSPGVSHQRAVGELFVILREYCMEQRIGEALISPADIELRPESIMQPDVFVVARDTHRDNEEPRWEDVKSLLLAVEVLSPSSVHADRVLKRDFYLANGVREYWIMDLDGRVVERWTPERATPELCRAELSWRPAGATDTLRIDLQKFFVERVRLPKRI